MAIQPKERFRTLPKDDLEWGRFVENVTATPTSGEVTDDSFADRTGNSLIGRSTNTGGKPADISVSLDQFLVNRAGQLVGSGLLLSDIPAGVATDSEVLAADALVTASFQAADAAHVAAVDPHPVYLTAAEGNAAYQPLASALARIYSGTGSPEGVLAAVVGSMYQRLDGGTGTAFYVKETGAATSTGWVAK